MHGTRPAQATALSRRLSDRQHRRPPGRRAGPTGKVAGAFPDQQVGQERQSLEPAGEPGCTHRGRRRNARGSAGVSPAAQGTGCRRRGVRRPAPTPPLQAWGRPWRRRPPSRPYAQPVRPVPGRATSSSGTTVASGIAGLSDGGTGLSRNTRCSQRGRPGETGSPPGAQQPGPGWALPARQWSPSTAWSLTIRSTWQPQPRP